MVLCGFGGFGEVGGDCDGGRVFVVKGRNDVSQRHIIHPVALVTSSYSTWLMRDLRFWKRASRRLGRYGAPARGQHAVKASSYLCCKSTYMYIVHTELTQFVLRVPIIDTYP